MDQNFQETSEVHNSKKFRQNYIPLCGIGCACFVSSSKTMDNLFGPCLCFLYNKLISWFIKWCRYPPYSALSSPIVWYSSSVICGGAQNPKVNETLPTFFPSKIFVGANVLFNELVRVIPNVRRSLIFHTS